MVNVEQLAENYAKAFPDRPGLLASHGWLTGTWAIGACYKNPNKLYGAYPYGYLKRVHAMFPEAKRILHVFSGGLTRRAAMEEAGWKIDHDKTDLMLLASGYNMELVDIHGPEQGRFPTWQGDLFDYCADTNNHNEFDLVLADPPYSADDAEKYNVAMVNRGAVTNALSSVVKPGGTLVWLDVVWPMFQKAKWNCYGHIGLVRSTNHRMRLVSMFEKV